MTMRHRDWHRHARGGMPMSAIPQMMYGVPFRKIAILEKSWGESVPSNLLHTHLLRAARTGVVHALREQNRLHSGTRSGGAHILRHKSTESVLLCTSIDRNGVRIAIF